MCRSDCIPCSTLSTATVQYNVGSIYAVLVRLLDRACYGPNQAEMADCLRESICLSQPSSWFHLKTVWATSYQPLKPAKSAGFVFAQNTSCHPLAAFGAIRGTQISARTNGTVRSCKAV